MNQKITIIREDNRVVVNGVGYWVDCSSLPAYVKAVQWNEDVGHVEFINDGRGQFLPNMGITDLGPYQHLVEKWTEADVAAKQQASADQRAREDSAAEQKRFAKK